jgi:hypothetical protein
MQTNDRGQRLVSDLQGISDFATPPVTRNDRALAERLGLFNADWYCAEYPDVAACGADPFAHYMQSGWREGRKPAPGFSAEDYAQLEQGFNPHECNPIVHLLQVGLGNPAVCRWLDDTARPAFMEQPASLRLHDGLCLIGYLRSEIGLGQAARNLAYACDARRLPMSFRHLPLPGREGVAEFMTKCITVPDRKANLLVVGLPSICDLTHEIGPGRVNILYPFWELSQIPRAWLDVARLRPANPTGAAADVDVSDAGQQSWPARDLAAVYLPRLRFLQGPQESHRGGMRLPGRVSGRSARCPIGG